MSYNYTASFRLPWGASSRYAKAAKFENSSALTRKNKSSLEEKRVYHLVGYVFSDQHEHNIPSMSIHGDEAHDALAVISLQF